mmetsp:Transcript_53258/g.113156  ORF Transcript_53258/g.113156 Transcript_53258/m.113156 type:complete len:217 (-) Transcript_53258:231-881(-)
MLAGGAVRRRPAHEPAGVPRRGRERWPDDDAVPSLPRRTRPSLCCGPEEAGPLRRRVLPGAAACRCARRQGPLRLRWGGGRRHGRTVLSAPRRGRKPAPRMRRFRGAVEAPARIAGRDGVRHRSRGEARGDELGHGGRARSRHSERLEETRPALPAAALRPPIRVQASMRDSRVRASRREDERSRPLHSRREGQGRRSGTFHRHQSHQPSHCHFGV